MSTFCYTGFLAYSTPNSHFIDYPKFWSSTIGFFDGDINRVFLTTDRIVGIIKDVDLVNFING